MHVFLREKLREKVEECGLSMNQFAFQSRKHGSGKGITPRTVSRVIYGDKDVNIGTILLMCAVLNISPRSLFKDKEKWDS